MKLSVKTILSTSIVAAALAIGGPAFAQANISTDSSVTTDTTTAAGMNGQNSVRPADSTMGETVTQESTTRTQYGQKHNDVDGAKSGTTQSDEKTESSSSTSSSDEK